jgi:hypothetical protein
LATIQHFQSIGVGAHIQAGNSLAAEQILLALYPSIYPVTPQMAFENVQKGKKDILQLFLDRDAHDA